MSYDEREAQAQLLEQLAAAVEGNDFEDFCLQNLSNAVGHREAVRHWLEHKAYGIRNPEPRRRRERRSRPAPRNIPEEEQPVWPPDPHWGVDPHGRFVYTDYDGESLIVRKSRDNDGSIWLDKGGEGPVFVRAEDVQVIIENIGNMGKVEEE
jgi:hypothetical protein